MTECAHTGVMGTHSESWFDDDCRRCEWCGDYRAWEVLSLGAGVQSTTIALLAGDKLPELDFAVFADTGGEPVAVYRHLDWLESVVSWPVLRVRNERGGGLTRRLLSGASRPGHVDIPAFRTARSGPLTRRCTKNDKIEPILRAIREVVAPGKRQLHVRDGRPLVRQWIGISRDEVHRVSRSRVAWAENWCPLIEELRWSRDQCMAYLAGQGVDAPRSSCVFCPYHTREEWARVAAVPEDWALALRVEAALEGVGARLHRSGQPLESRPWEFWGQQLDLWAGECDGVCGV